jgi:drug/metabolite transporter (DMT)-like permease
MSTDNLNGGAAGISAGAVNAMKSVMERKFFAKGLTLAVLSGVMYGLYSAFVTVAMGEGVWADWQGGASGALSAFFVVYVLGVLGSGINDLVSAAWAVGIAAAKGKLGDFFRCLRTKPGLIMVLCAVVGGPIASAAYIISLQMAGSIVIPITALCPAIGAILSRILFRQKLNLRMVVGIAVCFAATTMIGSESLVGGFDSAKFVGCIIALIAAFGWGIEGCIAGFGTIVIDYEIGITIRQCASGVTNLAIFFPLFCFIGGDIGAAPRLLVQAFSDPAAMPFFIISGFFALFAYSLWYKGNSMCGTALGMACNGAYSFWGPLFCWIVLGLYFGQDGWGLSPNAWVAAVLMFVGILVIAVNPISLLRGKGREGEAGQ